MPSYSDMIKFEAEAPQNTIRLVKSGGFYRAYNHSAWLFQTCITQYKVIRKFIKSLDEYIYYIGFPEKNLFDNIGDRNTAKTDFGFDIFLKEDEFQDESNYETWKLSVETVESSKSDYYSMNLTGREAEIEAIRRIREFPLESKSMIECVVFLSELRILLKN